MPAPGCHECVIGPASGAGLHGDSVRSRSWTTSRSFSSLLVEIVRACSSAGAIRMSSTRTTRGSGWRRRLHARARRIQTGDRPSAALVALGVEPGVSDRNSAWLHGDLLLRVGSHASVTSWNSRSTRHPARSSTTGRHAMRSARATACSRCQATMARRPCPGAAAWLRVEAHSDAPTMT